MTLQERALAGHVPGVVIVDATDWRIIPAENLIAAMEPGPSRLVVVTHNAADAEVMLTAIEVGVDGVILRTDDAAEVRSAVAVVRRLSGGQTAVLDRATVERVVPCGMGSRACVDLATEMVPGEGMLVGSFSRCLFLVASESEESGYIASRTFRVNAGAVSSYAALPGDRTSYLAELRTGDEVLVVDGKSSALRSAVVGRVKVEERPLVHVQAVATDGDRVSVLLQNAETVRLAGPDGTRSVSELAAGDVIYVVLGEGGRHTGLAINETVAER